MVAISAEIDSPTAVRRVNDTLRGPVAEVVGQFLPELKGLPRQQVYERALDDLALLQRCFEIFRRERTHFRYIVVDGRRRPVAEDDVPLSCGRTLQEVVAMVVRTAAKRYFRRRLARPAAGARRPGGPAAPPDELYDAIKDYLLHEWQVPLVPAYADMSPGLVRRLGVRLLALRQAEDLRRLVADPAAVERLVAEAESLPGDGEGGQADAGKSPVALLCEQLFTADGRRLRPEGFNDALLAPEVRAQLPQADRVVRVSDVLREVGGVPARLLLTGLGLSAQQLTVMIFTAHHAVGPELFSRLFGQPGKPELVLRIIQRGLAAGLGPATPLAECAAFVRRQFTRAAFVRDMLSGPPPHMPPPHTPPPSGGAGTGDGQALAP